MALTLSDFVEIDGVESANVSCFVFLCFDREGPPSPA